MRSKPCSTLKGRWGRLLGTSQPLVASGQSRANMTRCEEVLVRFDGPSRGTGHVGNLPRHRGLGSKQDE